MIIDNSSIELSGSHQKFEYREQKTSHQLFINELQAVKLSAGRLPGVEGALERAEWRRASVASAASLSQLSLAGSFFKPLSPPFVPRYLPQLTRIADQFRLTPAGALVQPDVGSANSGRVRLFQALFDALSGRSHRLSGAAQETAAVTVPVDESALAQAPVAALPPGRVPQQRPMIEARVQVTESYREAEYSAFGACGRVQTADGQTFDFNLNLEMSRSYATTTHYQRTEQVQFKDPLVVNFNGTAAELTEQKYQFDLDVDGVLDWISFTGEDGALLALDRNADGLINDGSELFGAISGDGFADLAQYDYDRNGFIDEADSIFTELKLWSKTAGEDRFESLQERNIDAIYLGATDTPFDLNDDNNQPLGRVRQSGIYLEESGAVGTVQQVDMVV